jgi:CHAT domain-containing protein/Tfp pilus assembly protein PilF
MGFLLVNALVGEEPLPRGQGEEAPAVIRIGVPIDSRLASTDPRLPDRGFHRAFRLVATRSGTVTVRMESRDVDAYLLVRDEAGNTVNEDDDGGPGDGAEAFFDAEAGVAYVIQATTSSEALEGRFRIEALEGEPERLTFAEERVRDLAWFQDVMRSEVSQGRKAQVLAQIGACHSALGAPHEAIKAWEECLERDRKRGVRDNEGTLLRHIGSAQIDLGDFQNAIRRFQEALEFFRQTGNAQDEGMTLSNLGAAHIEIGQPEKGIEYLELALRIAREQGFAQGEGFVLGNLGSTYDMMGQPERAIRYFEQALEIARRTHDRQGEGVAQMNLGNCHGDLGDRESAIERYESARRVFREINYLRGQATVLNNLATVHSERAQTEIAIKHCMEALEICEQAHDDRGKGAVLSKLGVYHHDLGEKERALEYHLRALEIHRQTMNRMDEALVLWNIAKLHRERGDDVAALEAFRNAHSIEMEILGRVERGLDESASQSLGSRVVRRGVADYLQLLVKLVRTARSREEKEALFNEALGLVEGFRARALAGWLRAGDFPGLLGPEGNETWRRLGALRQKNADLVRSTLERLSDEPEGRKEALARSGKEWQAREDEIASLERRLKAAEPRYASLFAGDQRTTAEDLAGLLGTDEILLHYNMIGEHVAILVWSQRGFDVQLLEATAGDLRGKVDALLADIRLREGEPTAVPELKGRLGGLMAELLPGLDDKLEGARSILVVPDGFLHLFPFEALVLDDGRYLVEKLGVRYAPSIGVLLELKRREESTVRARVLLAGDPDFGKSGPEEDGAAIALRLRGGTGFQKLEHARAEVDRIAGLFEEKTVLRGAEATEARFKEEAPRATLLHVATHGKYEQVGEGNALFYSGLAFAGLNGGGDGKEDGFLTAAEVMALDLRGIDLAVLSACDTAAGALQAHEGKFGLERAFFVAGVKAFIGSLWRVDDGATAEFMGRFYRHLLEGKTRAEALRLTKVDFIRGNRGPLAAAGTRGERGVGLAPKAAGDWSHPYYWAPFVFSGDGRGLRPSSAERVPEAQRPARKSAR